MQKVAFADFQVWDWSLITDLQSTFAFLFIIITIFPQLQPSVLVA